MLPGRNYSVEDVVRILWFRKWVLAASIIVCTCGAWGYSLRLPNQYRAETTILVIPQSVPDSYVHSTVTLRIEDRVRAISEEIMSRSRLEKVINEFNLYPELTTRPMEALVERMRANIDAQAVRDDAFKVSFTSQIPQTTMLVANRLAALFIEENSRDRSVMADSTNQFLESQLEDARRRLVDHEKKLEAFRTRNAGELPSQLATNLQVLQSTDNQIQNLSESLNRDRDRRLVLEKSIADALQSDLPLRPASDLPASGDSTAIVEGRTFDQLEQARNDLRALELKFKPEHPDVVAKKRLIVELERKAQQEMGAGRGAAPAAAARPMTTADLLRQNRARQYQAEVAEVDRQIASKQAEIDRLRQVVATYQHRVDAVPGHESELTDLMRDYDTLQKIYSSLLGKKEDSKISANLERQQVSEQFKILDRARLPVRPFSPNRVQIAGIAAGFGLMLGVGLAAFLEYRNLALRTEDEIVRALGLPVLAAIPIMNAIADHVRRRRLIVASVAATTLLVAGLTVASLWHFGLLKGLL